MVEFEFEEIKDKDLPRGFNANLDRVILQKNLTNLKKYRVMLPKKPDEPYGFGELIAIIVESKSEYAHTGIIYPKGILLEGDSRISDMVINDQFAMWLKYQKYM